jgi:N-methylhydantoinase B
VRRDIDAGLLSAEDALRVYGVGRDEAATAAARREMLSARLNGASPGDPVAPPEGATRAGDLMHVVDGRWWCNGADLGPVTESWKGGAIHQELDFGALAPEFAGTDPEMAGKITLHAWYCPVTGYRLDLELARGDEPPLVDMVLTG